MTRPNSENKQATFLFTTRKLSVSSQSAAERLFSHLRPSQSILPTEQNTDAAPAPPGAITVCFYFCCYLFDSHSIIATFTRSACALPPASSFAPLISDSDGPASLNHVTEATHTQLREGSGRGRLDVFCPTLHHMSPRRPFPGASPWWRLGVS